MKKVIYALTISLFSVFINQPANASFEVVMGALGPEVITNKSPGSSLAGPTVGGSNGGTVGGVGGSYAIVDSNGNVTNTIVCHSFCANGTFGPGGETAAVQIPNSNAGIWFGPNTTTYDRETRTFTAIDPVAREITNTNGDSSATVFGNRVLTFVSGNIFVVNEKLVGVTESWSLDSVATVSVTENNVSESLFLGNKKTNNEIQQLVNNSNLLLLNNRVQILINLLDSWVK